MMAAATMPTPSGPGSFGERDEVPPGERLAVALRPEASLAEHGQGELAVVWGWGRLIFRSLPEGLHQALRHLGEGVSRHELATEVVAVDGPTALGRLYYHLGELETRGLLERSARRGQVDLAVLHPLGEVGFPRPTPAQEPLRRDGHYVLSRLALLRRRGRGAVAESPLGRATVALQDPAALEIALRLLEPAGVSELVARLEGRIGHELDWGRSVEEILQLLIDARLVARATADGTTDEDHDARLELWAFHDLYFHQRSRFGRHDGSFGGTFPHVGRISPPPAVRPPWGARRIGLAKPDLQSLNASEPSLGEVIERRASLKSYSSTAISLHQLATFLYRVARVKQSGSFEVASPDERARATVEVTERPYPGGGRAYELELYLVVRLCEGVGPGLYHYDPLGHALEEVRSLDSSVQALLAYSCIAAQIAEPPPILIVVAARMPRVTWKYDAIAYATVLKDLGVLYQTMYLVATAMGLAPCALGSGSPDMFAEATGLDPLCETSVGEFMLGLPDDGSLSPAQKMANDE
jgi:SagB-type dehydrogenase family enzyme